MSARRSRSLEAWQTGEISALRLLGIESIAQLKTCWLHLKTCWLHSVCTRMGLPGSAKSTYALTGFTVMEPSLATPGKLVRLISDVLPYPLGAVTEIDRALVSSELKLRTRGGRGRSAAHVTPRDAANLLIATLASPVSGPKTTRAVDSYMTFAPLPLESRSDGDVGLPDLQALGGHHFVEAIESLIASGVSGQLADVLARGTVGSAMPRVPTLHIRIVTPQAYAAIYMKVGSEVLSLLYSRKRVTNAFRDDFWNANPTGYGDLRQVREITHRTLVAIGDLLAGRNVTPVPGPGLV
jgi:hypothetical protein